MGITKQISKMNRAEFILHLLFTAAYLGLSIYVQLAYVYSPMDIFVGGWGLAVVAFIGAGTLSPIFVMAFNKACKQNHFRSSCSKFTLYTLIALGCAIQLAFGVYVLISMGFNAYNVAENSMFDLMQAWDANAIARDTDYFQSYFECCGGLDGPQDWTVNVQQFSDYAEHFNATAKWPVPDGCLYYYEPDFPMEYYLQGLYYIALQISGPMDVLNQFMIFSIAILHLFLLLSLSQFHHLNSYF